jgi:glycerophosphoryl diester phosphodiesterase
MPAFEAAFASGLDIVETDVQLTADGVPVLLHDPTVDRTTNGHGAIADLTLAEVEKLDAGTWFSKKFAGTRVPRLGELLDLLAATPHKRAIVELKDYWTRGEIGTVLSEIYARGVQNRVVFAGINLGTIANLGDAAPAISRLIIRRDLPADPVGLAQFYGAIGIMTSTWSLESDSHAVAEMHAAGLGVLVYTLNSEERWTEATAYGVDGIVTDKPSTLDGWLAETAPGT